MSGTKAGGKAAAATNKLKYGSDFYKTIGSEGGKAGSTGGFYKRVRCLCADIEGVHYRQQCAGKLGGTISRRKKKED